MRHALEQINLHLSTFSLLIDSWDREKCNTRKSALYTSIVIFSEISLLPMRFLQVFQIQSATI